MTQKTIKALYKQPVNYKLMKDGYKTIKGVIDAQDGMPKILDLPTPSELYESDLVYNVDTSVNGAPIITTESFTLPDNEICEAKEYCYAPKGTNYNYSKMYSGKIYDNFTKIGSPTISQDGLLSNITKSNYLKLPSNFNSGNNSWEILFKVKTSSDISSEQNWIGATAGVNWTYPLWRLENGNVSLYLSSNGSSWDICANESIFSIETNTWYWLKLTFTGSSYNASYSTNGTEYTLAYTLNSSTPIYQNQLWTIGTNYWNSNNGVQYPWTGTIDLSESYIKINNKFWWLPYREATEEIITQIPGILDFSVTTDDWQQNQEYKLYQLKNQNNTDSLQLTENNITDTTQKYKQYINQLVIPARAYKWYYNGIPEESYPSYHAEGEVVISNGVASNFGESSFIEFNVYPRYYEEQVESFTTIIEFETGDSVTNHSLLELVNWHYNPTLDRYTEEMIYFSCIHNGKFSTTDDKTLTTFNDGTTLSPNTKYWMALYLTDENVRTYLIPDNNYTSETLPSLSSWTLENTITFSETMDIYYNEWFFGYYSDFGGENAQYNAFNGKLFVDNMLAFNGLTLDPTNIIWEPYYYYDYIYRWYANKSLYTYTENQNYADTLDFTNSWLNVTSNWKTQKKYINPNVCLMPIDGGETVATYTPNGSLFGNVSFDINSGVLSNFSLSNYLKTTDTFNPGSNPWEFTIKFTTSNDVSTTQFFISDEYIGRGCVIGIQNNTLIWYASNSQSASNWNILSGVTGITTLLTNTSYWAKFCFTGSAYVAYLSTTGEFNGEESEEINVTSSSLIYGNYKPCYGVQITGLSTDYLPFFGTIDLNESSIKINNQIWWQGIASSEIKEHQYILDDKTLSGCLYNYTDEGQQHNFDVYYDPNYTQPILVSSGQSYSAGTKVDTITIPAHRTWAYTTGGNWSKITYVDTSYSNYTYTDGNLVLTEYTGSDTDVIVPNAVI